MAFIYADTLAIASRGKWTERRLHVLDELSIGVVNKTAFGISIVEKDSITVVVEIG